MWAQQQTPKLKMKKYSCLLIGLAATIYTSSSFAASTPYGDCPNSADFYQSRYEASARAADLVCFQTALERELLGSTKPAVRSPSVSQGLSRTETYCADQQGAPGTLTKCILEQTRAEETINNYLKTGSEEKYRSCIGYSTGLRDLGSSENIDQTHVAKCLHTSNPEQKFRSCVIRYTGQPQKGGIIHWRRAEADKIADCFNG